MKNNEKGKTLIEEEGHIRISTEVVGKREMKALIDYAGKIGTLRDLLVRTAEESEEFGVVIVKAAEVIINRELKERFSKKIAKKFESDKDDKKDEDDEDEEESQEFSPQEKEFLETLTKKIIGNV